MIDNNQEGTNDADSNTALLWDNYSSAAYGNYAYYHPDDVTNIEENKEYMRLLLPSAWVANMNLLFESKALRPLMLDEMPGLPNDGDVLLGWETKFFRKNPYLSDLGFIVNSVANDPSFVNMLTSRADSIKISAWHLMIVRKANEDKKAAVLAPTGYAHTEGYYIDPASPAKLAAPKGASPSVVELLDFKNEHRELLANPAYKQDYIRCLGVICHCCGTPRQSASIWPKGGTRARNYHSGLEYGLCTSCRNKLNTTLCRMGTYQYLPQDAKDYIESLHASNNGKMTVAMLTNDEQYAIIQALAEASRELMENSKKKAGVINRQELLKMLLGKKKPSPEAGPEPKPEPNTNSDEGGN